MEVALAGWLIFSVLLGVFANKRGHNGFVMFFVGLLLSPLIGLIIEVLRSPNAQAT